MNIEDKMQADTIVRLLEEILEELKGLRMDNINKVKKVIAPGIWEDEDGQPHFNIPDLLKEFGLPVTPENRQKCMDLIKEVLLNKDPDRKIIYRSSKEDKGTPIT